MLPWIAILCEILSWLALLCEILPWLAILCEILPWFAIFLKVPVQVTVPGYAANIYNCIIDMYIIQLLLQNMYTSIFDNVDICITMTGMNE